MLALLWSVFTQVLLPIVVMFGAGWALDRKFALDLKTVVKLNINLFVPAFIFVHLVQAELPGSLAWRVAGFTAATSAILFILGGIVGRLMRYDFRETRAMQIAAMFYNSANYGIPLMALAYPGKAEVVQVFVILVQNIGNFTVGIFLASSTQHRGWRAMLPTLRQASVWAVTAALIVRGFGIPIATVPWVWVPLNYFAKGLVAVALITLGVQLSHTEHRQKLTHLGWALVLRLLAGPLVGVGLVKLFGFTGETACILVLSTSFPTAVNTALIAHEMKADHHYAAAAVFWSTVLSMITVTLLVAVLRLPAVLAFFN